MKAINLTNQTFGRLTVIKRAENSKHGSTRWVCQCVCGGATITTADKLNSGHTKSCGCLHHRTPTNFIDLAGKQFNRLTVIKRSKNDKFDKSQWECVCDCGKTIITTTGHLRSGNTKSCGCLHKEVLSKNNTTHGMCHFPEYRIWASMIGRCTNTNDHAYKHYGDRGITVYDEWRDNFKSFFNYIGARPSKAFSIERKNNNGNYEPGNVKWASAHEQANNTSRNHILMITNKSKTISQWSKLSGISPGTIHKRLVMGWSEENAVFKPLRHKRTP